MNWVIWTLPISGIVGVHDHPSQREMVKRRKQRRWFLESVGGLTSWVVWGYRVIAWFFVARWASKVCIVGGVYIGWYDVVILSRLFDLGTRDKIKWPKTDGCGTECWEVCMDRKLPWWFLSPPMAYTEWSKKSFWYHSRQTIRLRGEVFAQIEQWKHVFCLVYIDRGVFPFGYRTCNKPFESLEEHLYIRKRV